MADSSRRKTLGYRIEKAILDAKMNFSSVGRHMKVTRATVSNWASNKHQPDLETIEKLAKLTRVRRQWLLTGELPQYDSERDHLRSEDVAAGDMGDDVHRLDVVGYVGANGQLNRLFGVNQANLDKIHAEADDPETAVAVQIMGTSLGPMFDKWYAVYSDVRRPITEDLIGRLCVVGLPDDSVVLKWVRAGNKPGRFDLLSNDPTEPTLKDQEIVWAARAKLRDGKQP